MPLIASRLILHERIYQSGIQSYHNFHLMYNSFLLVAFRGSCPDYSIFIFVIVKFCNNFTIKSFEELIGISADLTD